jgi:hypothetical protein
LLLLNDQVGGGGYAQVIDVVGVIHFVDAYQHLQRKKQQQQHTTTISGGSSSVIDGVEEVMRQLLSAHLSITRAASAAPVQAAALSAVGLLGTLLPPTHLVDWIEE